MFRKLTLALTAAAAVGTTALAPSTAEATWWGHGHYGKYYGTYDYGPRYFYGPGFYHKRTFYGPRNLYGRYGWNRGYY
jgi:hypothetical protein